MVRSPAMNLAGKTFRLMANSSNGTVDGDTAMTFVSDDDRGVTAVYGGGTIRSGQVIAVRQDASTVEMLYQCITSGGDLKAGRAVARFEQTPGLPPRMRLDWRWLTGDGSAGESEWVLQPDGG